MSILPDAETFRRLADGSLSGPGPALLRGGLAALAVPYAAAVTFRNALFDAGLRRQWTARVPVVSVGNLTLGGTGKTPLVAWVARELARQGLRPAVVSRGYAARTGHTSDEAAELAILLPGVPHVADRDRVAAAARAVDHGANVVVLDDGFQHRRLRRNLDIVAVDATDPFGCDRLCPRGLLREPLAGLCRADAIVLTRADRIAAERRAQIRAAVLRARRGRPPAAWVETRHAPVGIRHLDGSVEPLEALAGRRLLAFCGIGNPAAFRHTLVSLGVELAGFRSFADHHQYSDADLDSLAAEATAGAAELVVTTLKDLVRLKRSRLADLPLVAVEVAIEPLGDAEPLRAVLAAATRREASSS
jgi:tetraacyldisaccharide 4'-kinase